MPGPLTTRLESRALPTRSEADSTGPGYAIDQKGIARAFPGPIGAVVPTAPLAAAPSLAQRVGQAFKAFAAAIVGPFTPIAPPEGTQQEGPRGFQYPLGANRVVIPRAEEGLTPFQWMVRIADLYDTLQMAILYRQEQMAAMDWDVIPRDPRKPPSDAQLSEARDRLERPDGTGNPGRHRFAQWITAALWDVLVTDALSIYMNRSLTGEILSWDLVAGDTIKPLIGGNGRVPPNPAPAYQQILYGRPFWEGTTNDLIYAPKNPRPRSAYGRSPVEMLIMTINRALRRQGHDLAYFSAGNIPEALVPAPSEWSTQQIETMQQWFDTVVADPTNRRKLWFIPSQSGRFNVFQFRPPILDTVVEEFLDKRTLAMLGVPPQEIGFTNDVNRATAGMQENVGQRRQMPYLRFFSGVISDMLSLSGTPDCMIQFAGERPDEDKLLQAQVDEIHLKNGLRSPAAIASERGFADDTAQKFVFLGTGPVPFPPTPEQITAAQEVPKPADVPQTSAEGAVPAQENQDVGTNPGPPPREGDEEAQDTVTRTLVFSDPLQAQRELRQWRRHVLRNNGALSRRFHTEALDPDLAEAIHLMLDDPDPALDRKAWAKVVFEQAADLLLKEVPA